MNDSIQSIRFVPQINKLNPKGRSGDKKGNKENKDEFSKHMSAKDKGVEGSGHDQVKENNESSEHKKLNDENPLQEKKDHDFDNGCGTILDTEI